VAEPTELATLSDRQETYLQSVSHVRMGIAPQNLEEGLRLAALLAKSTLVPKDFQGNPGNVMIAIQMGMEIGLPPMQALQSIAVINGRPSLWGDGLLAVCMSSPAFEWIDEPPVQNDTATCTVKRRGWPTPVARTFSIEDAKKAGLWGKAGPWQTYPSRMLRMRARAFALRDVFPDILRGLSCAEEQADVELVNAPSARPVLTEVRRINQGETVNTQTGEIGVATLAAFAQSTEAKTDAHAEPTPQPTRPDPTPSTPTFERGAVYHLARVWQPKPDKNYYLIETTSGLRLHTWSTTVRDGAKAALDSELAVTFTAESANFPPAPWRVTALAPQSEREPGSDDE
jgi:hypothetical protein